MATYIIDFVTRLGLNAESQRLLESQDPTVQMDLMTSFQPREGTRDVNSLFGSFVRSRASRRAVAGYPQTAAYATTFHDFNADGATTLVAAPAAPAGDSEEVQAFVARFGLDQQSLQTILNMTPEVQRDVLSSFHPQDATRDVNKLFQSFCKSRATGRFPGSAAAAAGLVIHEKQAHHVDFFNNYGLNETSQNALLALPLELQAEILVSFRPKDSTRDANSLFLAFVKSRTQTRFPQLSAVLNQAVPIKTNVRSTFYPTNTSPMAPPIPPMTQMPHVMSMMGYPYASPYAYGTNAYVDPSWYMSVGTTPAAPAYTVEQFAQAWNLNEISANLLQCMPAHVQSDVMQNFYPRDPTRDANGVFLVFAKARMQLYGINDTYGCGVLSFGVAAGEPAGEASPRTTRTERAEFALKHGLSQDASVELDRMSAPMQQKIMDDFFIDTCTSQNASSQFVEFVKSRTTSTFIDTFQLNSLSIEMFHGLGPSIQSDVVKNFAPMAHTRDMNSQFQQYVRSNVTGEQRGVKRSLDALNEDV